MFCCFRNVSHLAQAQVPSQLANGGDTGNNEVCARCGRAVFFAERVAGMGQVRLLLCLCPVALLFPSALVYLTVLAMVCRQINVGS